MKLTMVLIPLTTLLILASSAPSSGSTGSMNT